MTRSGIGQRPNETHLLLARARRLHRLTQVVEIYQGAWTSAISEDTDVNTERHQIWSVLVSHELYPHPSADDANSFTAGSDELVKTYSQRCTDAGTMRMMDCNVNVSIDIPAEECGIKIFSRSKVLDG